MTLTTPRAPIPRAQSLLYKREKEPPHKQHLAKETCAVPPLLPTMAASCQHPFGAPRAFTGLASPGRLLPSRSKGLLRSTFCSRKARRGEWSPPASPAETTPSRQELQKVLPGCLRDIPVLADDGESEGPVETTVRQALGVRDQKNFLESKKLISKDQKNLLGIKKNLFSWIYY